MKKLNKVNYFKDPIGFNKKEVKNVMPGWKQYQKHPNLKFDESKPYFIVTGNAGGHYSFSAVIDLDRITKKKILKDIAKKKKAKEMGRGYTSDFEYLPKATRKAILKDEPFPDIKESLTAFMFDFQLPSTYIVESGSGDGFHIYYFVSDNGIKLPSKKKVSYFRNFAIDIRANAGIVYGEGTQWKNNPHPYRAYKLSEDKITEIAGWKIAYATGLLNYGIAGVNLGDFISGIVNVHMPKNSKSEFIIWREGMFLLKKFGYNKDDVFRIYQEKMPEFEPDTTEYQIGYWWEKEKDEKRVRSTALGFGEAPPKPKKQKGKKKKSWYFEFDEWWHLQYGNKIRWLVDVGKWVEYNTDLGVFEYIPDEKIDRIVMDYLDNSDETRSPQKINLGIRTIKDHNHTELAKADENHDIRNILSGLLDTITLELHDHTPNYFSMVQMPVHIKEESEPTIYIDKIRSEYPVEFPRFERWLQAVIRNDMADELMCFVYGPTSSGKGTVFQLVKKMFGGAVSNNPIELLGESFGLSPLIGKLMNINSEMNISYLNETVMARMKHIVGMDGGYNVNMKNVKQFEYDFEPFFFLNASNQLPRLAPTDVKAWYRRVWLIHFSRTQPRDALMKKLIMDEIDDWFTYLLTSDYTPIIEDGMTNEEFSDFIELNKEQWEHSSQPVIRICEMLFIKSDDMEDKLLVNDVVSWVAMYLSSEGYGIMDRQRLTTLVTQGLASMQIYRLDLQKNYRRIGMYSPIKIIHKELKAIAYEQKKEEIKGSLLNSLMDKDL